jgi:hypothetical protein
LAVTALLVVSTVLNLALTRHEQATITPYGQRVAVEGGSLNVVDNGHPGPAIVLLGGLGSAAPGLEFVPLSRELKDYRVVVVEGLGYGYADLDGPERTVQNISEDLHAALGTAGVKEPYVLGGHSIAWFSLSDYVNRYPGAVSAVVGIDTTVPTFTEHPAQTPAEPEAGWAGRRQWPATTGLLRWVTLAFPEFVVPAGAAYTAEELDRTRLMAPGREHRIVVLEGPHHLHWEHSAQIAETIIAILADRGLMPHDGEGHPSSPATDRSSTITAGVVRRVGWRP